MRYPLTIVRRPAFTLIELLSVIALIGLLMSILIPVSSRVMDNSRRTRSLSNLRELGAATQVYTNDHAGYFPFLAGNTDSGNYSGVGWSDMPWSGALERYVLTSKWSFPSSEKEGTVLRESILINPQVTSGSHHRWGDYAGNTRVFIQPWWSTQQRMHMADISEPSRILMAMTARNQPDGKAAWQISHEYANGDLSGSVPHDFGTGYVLGVFVDGHVEAIQLDTFTDMKKRKSLLIP